MAASIRFDESSDPYMIQQIKAERDRRGDNTVSKTARDLIRERLTQIESAIGRPLPVSTPDTTRAA